MTPDVDRLLAEALSKHGIRIDANDPAIVMVTLNRLVLEDAARGVAEEIRQAADEFEQAATRVQEGLGKALAERARTLEPVATPVISSRAWFAAGLSSGVGLFSFGVAIGKWVLR